MITALVCRPEAHRPLDLTYDRPALDCYAAQLRGQLTGALDAAVQAAGGNPVTVAGTPDASETFKLAAIRQLAVDREFGEKVHSRRGITWGQVQGKLAGFISGMTAQPPQEAGCPGAPAGSERLTGVLMAAMRDPSGQGPGARLTNGMQRQVNAGLGNGQPAPILPPAAPPPQADPHDHPARTPATPPSRTHPNISR